MTVWKIEELMGAIKVHIKNPELLPSRSRIDVQ